jgi:hypothetical protein
MARLAALVSDGQKRKPYWLLVRVPEGETAEGYVEKLTADESQAHWVQVLDGEWLNLEFVLRLGLVRHGSHG